MPYNHDKDKGYEKISFFTISKNLQNDQRRDVSVKRNGGWHGARKDMSKAHASQKKLEGIRRKLWPRGRSFGGASPSASVGN
jgi:hypothetical protein